MDWDNLRYFVTLARTGSLSGAARALKVDHTTVARRIDALETELGVRLFDRLARGYRVTAEGEELLDLSGPVEDAVLALQRRAQARGPGVAGTVRISAPPVVASHFLAPRLGELRGRYPALRLELIGDSRAASLTRREADLALRLVRPEGSALIARRVGRIAYGLYAAPAYLAAREPPLWEFLGYDESLDHVPQQRWLSRLADARPLVLRTNDLATLYQGALAGLGLAALPRFLGDPDPRLERLPVDAAAATRELWLLVHPDLRRSPRVRAVLDAMVALIERNRPLLEGEPPAHVNEKATTGR